MGYVFLSAALLCGALKGYCGKKSSGFAGSTEGALLISLIRMLACVPFAALIAVALGDTNLFFLDKELILLSLISGVSVSAFVVTWLISVRRSAYMLLDVFLMLGTAVPILSGHLLYSEPISARQCIGFVLLTVAVLIMSSYNNTVKIRLDRTGLLLLILSGLSNGLTGATQKAFARTGSPDTSIFNLYTYVFSALLLGAFYALYVLLKRRRAAGVKAATISNHKSKDKRKSSDTAYNSTETELNAAADYNTLAEGDFDATFKGLERTESKLKVVGNGYISTVKKSLPYVLVMAATLAAHSYFSTLAAGYLDGAVLYPLQQGASLLISTFMASLLFGERINKRALVGILLSFISLVIINV
jgi:multidrug transporter EmrE-like cation transporter